MRDKECLYGTFRFVVSILGHWDRPKVVQVLSYAASVVQSIINRRLFLTGVPESLLRLVFPQESLQTSELLLMSQEFIEYDQKWTSVCFSSREKTYVRILKIIVSPLVPQKCSLMSNFTLFNIRSCLKPSPYLLPSHQTVKMLLQEKHDLHHHREATKMDVSFFNDSYQLSQSYINETLENFVSTPKFAGKGDVIGIDLSVHGAYHKQGTIHFRVVQVECGEESSNEVFAVTRATSIYSEKTSQGFRPTVEWEFVENDNIRSFSPILPLGLEDYYNQILTWFIPFFSNHLDGKGDSYVGDKLQSKWFYSGRNTGHIDV